MYQNNLLGTYVIELLKNQILLVTIILFFNFSLRREMQVCGGSQYAKKNSKLQFFKKYLGI